jgi:hypothetical protein
MLKRMMECTSLPVSHGAEPAMKQGGYVKELLRG